MTKEVLEICIEMIEEGADPRKLAKLVGDLELRQNDQIKKEAEFSGRKFSKSIESINSETYYSAIGTNFYDY